MSPDQVLERERRLVRPVAILGVVGLLLLLVSLFLQGSALADAEGSAERLIARDDSRGAVFASAFMAAGGLLLFAPVLTTLFMAARDRSGQVRPQFIGLVAAGPILVAVAQVLLTLSLDAAASDFVAAGGAAGQDEAADDAVRDQDTLRALASGVGLAGAFSLIFGMVYTSLHSMRTGLLTRFTGSLGMALGVATLFPNIGALAVPVYIAIVVPAMAGWTPGARPPAWETGEAVPWPRPGEQMMREQESERQEEDPEPEDHLPPDRRK